MRRRRAISTLDQRRARAVEVVLFRATRGSALSHRERIGS